MIVYIESNFVLELALGQEEFSAVQAILELAENHKIELVVPTFALSEPFSTMGYRAIERKRLYEALTQHATQLERSHFHQQLATDLRLVLQTWLDDEKQDASSLELLVKRLFNVSVVIDWSSSIFEQATDYRDVYDLSIQDAIIYSSVIADLKQRKPKERKCFISRNSNDFDSAEIRAELGSYNCRYIARFRDGLAFIQSGIK